jgi:hypothetical protein
VGIDVLSVAPLLLLISLEPGLTATETGPGDCRAHVGAEQVRHHQAGEDLFRRSDPPDGGKPLVDDVGAARRLKIWAGDLYLADISVPVQVYLRLDVETGPVLPRRTSFLFR